MSKPTSSEDILGQKVRVLLFELIYFTHCSHSMTAVVCSFVFLRNLALIWHLVHSGRSSR